MGELGTPEAPKVVSKVTILPPAGRNEMLDSAVKDQVVEGRRVKTQHINDAEKARVAEELNMGRIEDAGKAIHEGDKSPYQKIVAKSAGIPRSKDD